MGTSSYNWTTPSDATVASGQGTANVTVDMGIQSGNVSVRTENGCCNSTYKDFPITIGIPALLVVMHILSVMQLPYHIQLIQPTVL